MFRQKPNTMLADIIDIVLDPIWYNAQYPDVAEAEMNPQHHFLSTGMTEGRDPSPLFNSDYYLQQNPDVKEAGLNAFEHYFTTGGIEGRTPHPLFDSHYYLSTYSDVQELGINPLLHFINTGAHEGRNPNPYFIAKWYKTTYADEKKINPILHYQQAVDQVIRNINTQTPIENVPNPNPWFDTAWYLLENQDVLELKMNPLIHYMEAGILEGRSPSEKFDPNWYATNIENLGGSLGGIDSLRHFLTIGAVSGIAPNALWQATKDNLAMGPDLSLAYDNEGYPTIDPQQYETLKKSNLFNSNWYSDKYLAPTNNKMDPIDHYLIFGANLGYNPGPDFNTKAYRSINHDLRSAAINPLLHYIRHGRFEGRHATKENRENEVKNFRFSQPEYGPFTDILAYDSDVQAPSHLTETICLHLHLFHTDMAEEFCEVINRLTLPFTFLVSIQAEEDEAYWTQYFSDHITHAQKLVVKSCPNRGRDVQPWLIEFKDIIRDHDIFCHLHTKKSGYNKFQKSWRRYLTHTTFGTKTLVNQILSIFANDENVGLVFPAYFYILRNQPNYGKNFEQYERLYTTLFGNLPDEECPDYPAGSFFWARTKTLEPLLSLDLTLEDFDEEDGQTDGTIAHALERILGSLPEYTGHTKRCIAVDVPFDLTRYIHPARIETLSPELFLPSSFNLIKDDEDHSSKAKPRVAVYTAITGGYENLVRPLIINPDIDYFVFTDTPEKFNPDWAQVIQTPYISDKPVKTARYVKSHAHFWFADYDYAIWMDANVLPATNMSSIIEKVENTGYHAAFIQHPLRYNCMEEGNELIKFNIDNQALIEEQLTRYGVIPEIFAEELIETNLFICRPKLKITKDFMTLWWSELNNYSHRDQLSVNYAILKSGLKWAPLFDDNISIRDHPDFFLLEHELHNRDEFIEKVTSNIRQKTLAPSIADQEESAQVSS